jgi:hypothetical protein
MAHSLPQRGCTNEETGRWRDGGLIGILKIFEKDLNGTVYLQSVVHPATENAR